MNCSACGNKLGGTAAWKAKNGLPSTGLCGDCYRAHRAAQPRAVRKHRIMHCPCGEQISRGSKSGLCRRCAAIASAANPIARKARMAGLARLHLAKQIAARGDVFEQEAEFASALLVATIERVGLTLAPQPERPALTFEEQLALVASGKARVVEKLVLPSRECGFSTVGCAAAMVVSEG